MKKLLGLCLLLVTAPAFAATLTFDTDFTGPSYTEQGFTITALPATPSGVVVSGGYWNVPCCPSPALDEFILEISGPSLFNLISIDPIHIDSSDPVTFKGFVGATEVASQTITAQGGTFVFSGDFQSLESVLVSVSGTWSDPTFDNLSFEWAAVVLDIDIKFCSDPNAFNCKKKGVLPVTIFGTEAFDVADIDIGTLQLCKEDLSFCTGAPRNHSIADRGDPTSDLGAAQCTLLEVDPGIFEEQDYLTIDGFLDLDVAFEAREVQVMLVDFCSGAKKTASEALIIIGSTIDGTPIPIYSVPIGNTGIDQLWKANK